MRILGIDRELSDRSKKGLVWLYKKYKAFNTAIQLMDQLSQQGKWPLPKKASRTEVIEIFVSKSFWHSHVVGNFNSVVGRFPQMVEWLEREEGDLPSDFEVWHLQKSEYGFKELELWIANDGTLDKVAKAKLEKAKAKKGKGKAKDKGKESDDSAEDKMEVDVEEIPKKKSSSSKANKSHKRK
jgi:hypothetical protein